jgi:hypothetical protein
VRILRVGDVDRSDRLKRGARGVEGLAVGGEAALVPEARDRRLRIELRVAAVLADVVDREHPGLGGEVAVHRCEQPALLVQVQRLVRREHRQRRERVGLHRVRRVRHVEHGDALGARARVERVEREHQRGVVEGALVARRIDVAEDLEAALGPLVPDEGDVAVQSVLRRPGRHPPVDARLHVVAR